MTREEIPNINPISLQIGDWVEFNSEPMEVIFNCRVTEIGKDYIKTDKTGGDEIFKDEIFPIPLSEENLKENGWHCYNDYNTYTHDDGRVGFQLHGVEGGYFDVEVPAYEFGYGAFTSIRFIHELQHALRLCGIEKEITL